VSQVRPLEPFHFNAVGDLAYRAFADLDTRQGRAGATDAPNALWYSMRTAHIQGTDPGGCFALVADDGSLAGVSLALRREGVWGLSLLAVDPAHQEAGSGRALLEASLSYAEPGDARLILASDDSRAIRLYARTGHRLIPAMDAEGPLRRRPEMPASVRAGVWPDDVEIVDAAGRAVRGANYGRDIGLYVVMGAGFFVHEDLGFAIARGGSPAVIAATNPAAAADLLRACLSQTPDGTEPSVQFITHANHWAIDVALECGLPLKPAGPVCVHGDPGPLAPGLLSGAFL
jgi:GNAT superfamily N-acetyltransferase